MPTSLSRLGDWTGACTTAPTAPGTPFLLGGGTPTSLKIGWTDNSNNKDGFYVYRNQALVATLPTATPLPTATVRPTPSPNNGNNTKAQKIIGKWNFDKRLEGENGGG